MHSIVRRVALFLTGIMKYAESQLIFSKKYAEEPLLQEITGKEFKAKTTKIEKDARPDISARGFWMRGQKVFCDVRVFNPLTKCHRSKSLSKVHEINEKEKKVKYAARIIEVEHGSFTPLVFSWWNEPGV